jgi:hypothetical protein
MSTAELTAAKIAKARWLFYKSDEGKKIAPIQANEKMIEAWADENLQSIEDVEAWKNAAAALFGSLVEKRDNIVVEKPRAEAPAPEPVLEGQDLLRKLQKDVRSSENPAVVFAAQDQLRRIASGPQREGELPLNYFRRLYPKVSLKRMGPAELDFVVKKYGATKVASVLNSNGD